MTPGGPGPVRYEMCVLSHPLVSLCGCRLQGAEVLLYQDVLGSPAYEELCRFRVLLQVRCGWRRSLYARHAARRGGPPAAVGQHDWPQRPVGGAEAGGGLSDWSERGALPQHAAAVQGVADQTADRQQGQWVDTGADLELVSSG